MKRNMEGNEKKQERKWTGMKEKWKDMKAKWKETKGNESK